MIKNKILYIKTIIKTYLKLRTFYFLNKLLFFESKY